MEAVVLFEYEQQQGDELNLVVGEIISDVKQVQPHRQKRERERRERERVWRGGRNGL